ncbi:MAG: hypothetical protein P1V18_06115 [Candidatus Gracilibacteria bacterium]|nr:hypothetical protein [Candidatus Gracilibacteria bacterium]
MQISRQIFLSFKQAGSIIINRFNHILFLSVLLAGNMYFSSYSNNSILRLITFLISLFTYQTIVQLAFKPKDSLNKLFEKSAKNFKKSLEAFIRAGIPIIIVIVFLYALHFLQVILNTNIMFTPIVLLGISALGLVAYLLVSWTFILQISIDKKLTGKKILLKSTEIVSKKWKTVVSFLLIAFIADFIISSGLQHALTQFQKTFSDIPRQEIIPLTKTLLAISELITSLFIIFMILSQTFLYKMLSK